MNRIPQQKLRSDAIPYDVAIHRDKDIENEFFTISYRFYNDKECGIDSLVKNNSKRFLKDLRKIGNSNPLTLQSNNISSITVKNSGEYKKLYSKLTEDVQILEHKGSGTSRLFYFYSGFEFYIIAITSRHYETNKNRR